MTSRKHTLDSVDAGDRYGPWAPISLGIGAWISIPMTMLLVRSVGTTLGAGDGGASNAVVLRLLVGAAVALPIAAIAGVRTRWTGLAVTAAMWSLTSLAAASIVPQASVFTMSWALAGVGDALAFVSLPLLFRAMSERRRAPDAADAPDAAGAANALDVSNGVRATTVILFAAIAVGAFGTAVGAPWFSLNWRGVLLGLIGLALPGVLAAATVRFNHDPVLLNRAKAMPVLSMAELCAMVVAGRRRRRGLLSSGLFGAVLAAFVVLAPTLLTRRWALSTAESGMVFGEAFAAAALGALIAGRLRRNGRDGIVERLVPVLSVVAIGAALAIPKPTFLFVSVLSIGFLLLGAVLAAALGAAVSDSSETEMATACGLAFVVLSAGGAIGILAATTIDRRFGTAMALAVVGIPAAFAAIVNLAVPTDATERIGAAQPWVDEGSLVSSAVAAPLIELRNIDVFYGAIQVLFGVNLTINHGEIVALLGTNGAGKSTALKVIAGQVLPRFGVVLLEGTNITALSAERRVPLGLAQIPGGRAVFGSLTVIENLELFASSLGGDKAAVKRGIEKTFVAFPRLEQHRNRDAETLSGGEQQMLALGKGLLLQPRLLCVDELSLGLAPSAVADLLDLVRSIHADGTTIVLVEQSVNVALSIADRAIFMEKGEVRFDGPAHELNERSDLLRSVFLQGAAAPVS